MEFPSIFIPLNSQDIIKHGSDQILGAKFVSSFRPIPKYISWVKVAIPNLGFRPTDFSIETGQDHGICTISQELGGINIPRDSANSRHTKQIKKRHTNQKTNSGNPGSQICSRVPPGSRSPSKLLVSPQDQAQAIFLQCPGSCGE